MTSIPASRSARAMIFAPRSWPSRPGLATTTRILRFSAMASRSYGTVGHPGGAVRPAGHGAGARERRAWSSMAPERLSPLDRSFLHVESATAHMHVPARARFVPDPALPPVTVERVRELV